MDQPQSSAAAGRSSQDKCKRHRNWGDCRIPNCNAKLFEEKLVLQIGERVSREWVKIWKSVITAHRISVRDANVSKNALKVHQKEVRQFFTFGERRLICARVPNAKKGNLILLSLCRERWVTMHSILPILSAGSNEEGHAHCTHKTDYYQVNDQMSRQMKNQIGEN